MLFNAKDYKFSKIVVDDLSVVLNCIKQMDGMIQQLEPYVTYKYVAKLVSQYKESKEILEVQLTKYSKIKANKGVK